MNEDHEPLPSRLDAIATRWSLVQRAHRQEATLMGAARDELVLRYSTAIRRYIQGIMRGEAATDDVAQDVVVRMLSGDFGGADPERGRFRDFLKTAIRNMVRNHWDRENRRQPAAVEVQQLEISQDDEQDADWDKAWRDNVLKLSWAALEEEQQAGRGNIAYAVLRMRTDFPDDSSEQLAKRLSEQFGEQIRADAVRQKLRRARRRFAELVIEEVAHGLDSADHDRLQEELIAVGLFEHVRDALPSE